jgi:predicted naringenin-chalcone synthase
MNTSLTALGDFQTMKPPFERPQSELVTWITRCHQAAATEAKLDARLIEKLFRRYSVSAEKISRRSFECADLESFEGWSHNKIYRFNEFSLEGASIRERMGFFSERAQAVFEEFYPRDTALPDHLIHVTCTGYVSPSAAQLKAAGRSDVSVTHAYHMGCYASLPAIRMADAFLRSSSKDSFSTDIVHTEMCGLHMNAADHSPEQIVVQTLFADGHIKYSVKEAGAFAHGFRVLNTLEEIVPNSASDITWIPSHWGMQMTLSREVPDKIAANLRPFLQKTGRQQQRTFQRNIENGPLRHPSRRPENY